MFYKKTVPLTSSARKRSPLNSASYSVARKKEGPFLFSLWSFLHYISRIAVHLFA